MSGVSGASGRMAYSSPGAGVLARAIASYISRLARSSSSDRLENPPACPIRFARPGGRRDHRGGLMARGVVVATIVVVWSLGQIFKELAQQKESKEVEGHLMPDHVHMCISIPPKYAVSNVVG